MASKVLVFLRAGFNEKLFSDNVRRALTINLFSFVGMLSLLYFLVGGLVHQRVVYSLIVSVFFIFTLINLIVFHIKKNLNSASFLVAFLMFMLNSALVIFLGENITGLFWTFVLPIVATFLIGKNKGVFFSFLLLALVIFVFKTHFDGITNYPSNIQERYVVIYIAVVFLIYFFENIREKTFEAFLTADREKSEYLEEVLMQKEEIQAQAELMEQKNLELAQLSLVASETDNVVVIADADGNIQWVNRKFEMIYGYNINDFLQIKKTIFDLSNNKQELTTIKTSNKSVSYINQTKDKNDNFIWVQSTVTPFFEREKLKKIIILETDITQLKIFEQKIMEQNEELRQQTEEINAQREELIAKNELITQKNEAIGQSIQYAFKLQNSILPDISKIKYENFLIFKPRDVVSGDFYWAEKIDNDCFFGVIDCTGHGVPAAFLSILGSRILNEIVNFRQISSPAMILEHLHQEIIKILKQQSSDQNSDGMDIILTKISQIDLNKFNVTFCGAKRPLIYFDSSKKLIIKENGIKRGIGGYNEKHFIEFTDSEITLDKGSILYLTSDGYIDQHSPINKRIGTKHLLEIIEFSIENSMEAQQQKLLLEFASWKGDYMQIDDVTIWGIKL